MVRRRDELAGPVSRPSTAPINAVVDSGLRNANTALSNALYLVQKNDYDVTLDVVTPRGASPSVVTPSDALTRRPTLADVQATLTDVVARRQPARISDSLARRRRR